MVLALAAIPLDLLHPGPVRLCLLVAGLFPLLGGWAIGLLCDRRPYATVLVPLAAFGFVCAVAPASTSLMNLMFVASGFEAGAGPASRALVGAIFQGVVLAAGLGLPYWTLLLVPVGLSAAAGVALGRRTRRSRRAISIGAGLAAAGFLATIGLTEAPYRVNADRFVRGPLATVEAAVREQLVDLPDSRAPWKREATGVVVPELHLTTHWRAETEVAGPGRCELEVSAWLTTPTVDPKRAIGQIEFAFTPEASVEVSSEGEAQALLDSLGVVHLDRALWKNGREWVSNFVRPTQTANAYHIEIQQSGHAQAICHLD
ncbi:MAG TPA: hypothetical protein QGH10_17535 [Armatimonadota bacterium]|nr:hypothetical protein [Armatimonadota bacterium]